MEKCIENTFAPSGSFRRSLHTLGDRERIEDPSTDRSRYSVFSTSNLEME
jgi:hypothetical protein